MDRYFDFLSKKPWKSVCEYIVSLTFHSKISNFYNRKSDASIDSNLSHESALYPCNGNNPLFLTSSRFINKSRSTLRYQCYYEWISSIVPLLLKRWILFKLHYIEPKYLDVNSILSAAHSKSVILLAICNRRSRFFIKLITFFICIEQHKQSPNETFLLNTQALFEEPFIANIIFTRNVGKNS